MRDLIAWCEEAARYFENRPTGGEDAAHWANVANAENARKIAAALRAASEREAELETRIKLRERQIGNRDAIIRAQDELVSHAKVGIGALAAALEALLDRYLGLVNSGDCGFWNPEEEPEVIAARLQLGEARAVLDKHRPPG